MTRGGVWLFLLVIVVGCNLMVEAEQGFPPPPLPRIPKGWNIHCDVCQTMMSRMTPYCEREDQNNDYLPDFCIFNYNRVLRSECDYVVEVAEYVWCPNACQEVRHLQSFAGDKICHHPLVNCTERAIPSPSPSPSPTPSMDVPRDCVLCEYILKHVSEMCMNRDEVNEKNIYHVCMDKTNNRVEFTHCEMFLNELTSLAGTDDPCDLVTCNPGATCQMDETNTRCHVRPYSNDTVNFIPGPLTPDLTPPSHFATYSGLGPGDFRPGQKPYHSADPRRPRPLPSNVRMAGHLRASREPSVAVTPDGIEKEYEQKMDQLKEENEKTIDSPPPLPLSEVDMQ